MLFFHLFNNKLNFIPINSSNTKLFITTQTGSGAKLTPTIVNKKISKGDVFQIARLAGIMSAKKTSEIIPLCHPIIIDSIDLYLDPQKDKKSIIIKSKVICRGPTGVEMEALTAVSSAALTIYDMCKSIDRGIKIKNIQLLKKSGGKSGTWTAENE